MSYYSTIPEILVINNNDLGIVGNIDGGVRVKSTSTGYNRKTDGTTGPIGPSANDQTKELLFSATSAVEEFVIGKGYRMDSANIYDVNSSKNYHRFGASNNNNKSDPDWTYRIGPFKTRGITQIGVIPCCPEIAQRVYIGACINGGGADVPETEVSFTNRFSTIPGRRAGTKNNIYVPPNKGTGQNPEKIDIRYTLKIRKPDYWQNDMIDFKATFETIGQYNPGKNRWETLTDVLNDIAAQINKYFSGSNQINRYKAFVISPQTAIGAGGDPINTPCLVIEGFTYRDVFTIEFPRSTLKMINGDSYENGFTMNPPDSNLTGFTSGMSIFTVPVIANSNNGPYTQQDFLPNSFGRLYGRYLDTGAIATDVIAIDGSSGNVSYEGSTRQIMEYERTARYDGANEEDSRHLHKWTDKFEINPKGQYSAIIINHDSRYDGFIDHRVYNKVSVIAWECMNFEGGTCSSDTLDSKNASLFGAISALMAAAQTAGVVANRMNYLNEYDNEQDYSLNNADVTDRYGRVFRNFLGSNTICV